MISLTSPFRNNNHLLATGGEHLNKSMRTLGNIIWHFPFLGFIDAFLTFLIGGLLLRLAVLSAGQQTSLEASGFKFRSPAVAPEVDWPIGKLPPS